MVSIITFVAARVVTQAAIPPTVQPARAMVAQLSQQLGRPVEIERSLGAIPVLVDAPGLAPKAVVLALASALRASIVTDGKALRIERSTADKKAVAAGRFEIIRARAVRGMAAWDETLHRADAVGDIATQVRTFRAEAARARQELMEASLANRSFLLPAKLIDERMVSPAGRLLHDLMARLGPDRLAQFEIGGQAFFSDRPNGSEWALPPCADLVATYAATQKTFEVAMGQPSSAETVAKVILRVDGSGASIDLYGANGKRLNRGLMSYRIYVFGTMAEPPTARESRWIGRDVSSRRMASILVSNSDPLKPEELPEAYLHPERIDPLSFDVQTALLEFRRSSKAPALVAVLSDDLLGFVEGLSQNEQIDAAAFQWRLLGERGFETVERDGVTILRPKDAMTAEASLANREALGAELRRIVGSRDYGTRSRCLMQAALYTGCGPSSVEDKYVRTLQRLFGTVSNDSPSGALALGGAALRKNFVTADAATPPFDWLIRDGISKGWLQFEGPPGTPDLDLAPSSLLAALKGARLQCATLETPVVMRCGKMSVDAVSKVKFFGEDPETVGTDAMETFTRLPEKHLTEERKQYYIKVRTKDAHYILGRRQTFGVEVRLPSGLHAKQEFLQQIADRRYLTLDELPSPMQEAILRGAQAAFNRPSQRLPVKAGEGIIWFPPVGP